MGNKASSLSSIEFTQKTNETLDKLYVAFLQLAKENDAGFIQVQRTPSSLVVTVKKIGSYTITSNSGVFSMQSPQSGLYNYSWDSANGFWKSQTQEHILEELLVREFCAHSKGLLNL